MQHERRTDERARPARTPRARDDAPDPTTLPQVMGNSAFTKFVLRRRAFLPTQGAGPLHPEIERAIASRVGAGSPLPNSVREEMESFFGVDLSDVRVHTDHAAAELNAAVQAEAFTTGPDIFFGAGGYAPDDRRARRLLTHEITHVLQPTRTIDRVARVSAVDDAEELEAERVANSFDAVSDRLAQRRGDSAVEPSRAARPVDESDARAIERGALDRASRPSPPRPGAPLMRKKVGSSSLQTAREKARNGETLSAKERKLVVADAKKKAEDGDELEAFEVKLLQDAAVTQAREGGGEDAKDARTRIADDLKEARKEYDSWFRDIEPNAKFLGKPIVGSVSSVVPGVHKRLAEALERAEVILMNRLSAGFTGAAGFTGIKRPNVRDLADYLVVKTITGLRPPTKATGGEAPSPHCYGLAVDINYKANPYVRFEKSRTLIERATQLMGGRKLRINVSPPLAPGNTPEDKMPRGHAQTEEEFEATEPQRQERARAAGRQWERLHKISDQLRAYLSLDPDHDVDRLIEEHGGDDFLERINMTPATLREQVRADQQLYPKLPDFEGHEDPKEGGFMDLPKVLVESLVEAGLTWGGCYHAGKDIMHFDLRTTEIVRRRFDDPNITHPRVVWGSVYAEQTEPAPDTRADEAATAP
jgi:hypothetical protein